MTRPKFSNEETPAEKKRRESGDKRPVHGIQEYKLVGGCECVARLNEEVNQNLKDGWLLHDRAFAHGDYHAKLYQTMVKY